MFVDLARSFTPISLVERCADHCLQLDPGDYLRWNHATRERELDVVRWLLFFRLVAEIAGSSRPHTMAQAMCNLTDSPLAVKQRFVRMSRFIGSFDASARRKNGVVASSRTKFGDRCALFDELIDAPIWKIAKRCSWDLTDLDALLSSVEGMGFEITETHDLETSFSCGDIFHSTRERKVRGYFGRSSQWALLNTVFFRMRRAEAVGDVEGYIDGYYEMQGYLECGLLLAVLRKGRYDKLQSAFFTNLCQMFSMFLSHWHSRIRMNSSSNIEIVHLVNDLRERGLPVWGLSVEKSGKLRSIAGRAKEFELWKSKLVAASKDIASS
ncbi:hypothetical protein [Paraburkholderia youngii]|uniref:Uncharacterized protein n=1 Tax=Paraburkholderia youngii TaxID=2782701 RepID=A0A7Y6JX33_9BURK|nr:hypothetical protein [Paraburkholderia youngii]NUX99534.1 hypothetical protein [Paraburkholderia youngii]